MEFFSVNELQSAMESDADSSSHAISFPVSKPSDIRRIFDPISYSKGASIIRMMSRFLGEKAFKNGLQAYLRKFQYDNAVQVNFILFYIQMCHCKLSPFAKIRMIFGK